MTPVTFFLALLFAASTSALAQLPACQVTKMGNGLTVILVEDHTTQLAAVEVWVKAGTAYETQENSGVSHFIEHLAFSATANYGPGEMDLEMESAGATLDARTSRDWARYGVTVMSSYLPKALAVLAEAIVRPRFRDIDIEKEQLVILDEIAKKQTDPFKVCKDYLAGALFGEHPYGLPLEGSYNSLRTISRSAIVDYHRSHYLPERTAVVVVGDVDPQAAISAIGKAFQGYASSGTSSPEIAEPVFPKTQAVREHASPYKLDYVGIAFPGPPASSQVEVCAMDLLVTYLGSGYRSWLSEELKDRQGLIEQGFADYLTQVRPGMVCIIASAKPGMASRVKEAVLAKVASVRNQGVEAGSLSLARRALLGQYAFQNETVSGIAQSYGFYHTVLEAGFAAKYVGCVQAVSNDDIVRTAREYLDPERAAIVVLRSEGKESP